MDNSDVEKAFKEEMERRFLNVKLHLYEDILSSQKKAERLKRDYDEMTFEKFLEMSLLERAGIRP